MSGKRKLTPLTVEFKRKVIKTVEENPTKMKSEIAKEFNIPSSTLYTILKNKDKYEEGSGVGKTCVRAKKGEFQEVEECVVKWLRQCRDKNLPISGPLLQEKAQEFAKALLQDKFGASNGWLHNFKKRHDVVFKKVCGESASVDNAVCSDWMTQIKDQVAGYKPEDIYNADETGLFFKCLPDKTLTFKGDSCNGGKHSKERITVLLCTNSKGTDKSKPLVIGKSQKPRCFKNVNNLPTEYMASKKAWMTGDIFGVWLKNWDKQLKKEKRKILLFIDNCTAHGDLPKLINIKVKFLPPNTTSKLQPLDQGIIKNFKCNYRKEVVRLYLNNLEEDTLLKINLLGAIWMIAKAWNNVTEKTIKNCFKKSGFQVTDEPGPEISITETAVETEPIAVEPLEWQQIADSLNVDHVEFEEFATFDDDLAICGELTEADIVESVSANANPSQEDEDDIEDDDTDDRPNPTTKDARNAITVLKCFFEKKGDMSESVIKSITEIDSALDYIHVSSSKQTKIDDFFINVPSSSSATMDIAGVDVEEID